MAEKQESEKQHKADHKIYKAGDKYVCGECGAEVTYEVPNCPTCKVNFDWTDVLGNIRYG